MLSSLYNLLWYPALPFALIAAHPANMRDYRERMGHGDFPQAAGALRIWIHASSVGEIEAIRPVANGLLDRHPGTFMVITTMTTAGRDAAQRRIPGAAAWMLAPLDNRRAVRSFLKLVRPRVVLITETEIWPNYFIESARSGATVAVVNGRISERSLRRYLRARGLFEDALSHLVGDRLSNDRHLEFFYFGFLSHCCSPPFIKASSVKTERRRFSHWE